MITTYSKLYQYIEKIDFLNLNPEATIIKSSSEIKTYGRLVCFEIVRLDECDEIGYERVKLEYSGNPQKNLFKPFTFDIPNASNQEYSGIIIFGNVEGKKIPIIYHKLLNNFSFEGGDTLSVCYSESSYSSLYAKDNLSDVHREDKNEKIDEFIEFLETLKD